MRIIGKVAAATLALLLACPLATLAQEAQTPAPPAAAPPKAPIPYTALKRSPAPKAPPVRPAAPRPATGTAAAPAAAILPLPTTPSGARLAVGEALPPAELESFIDGVMREAMAREHIAGAVVGVVQNGQVVMKKGYGFAGLSPQRRVDPDRTLFRLGSISKTFTWIALMREVEAGRIRIDAPVNLYLPERLQVRDQGYREPVRVAHLMDHSAGFEDRALGHLFERRWQRERTLADYLRQERPRRVHAPGAVSSYSNYGAALAGEAVSYVSDRPFERLVEDRIFVPLRLARTTFREPRPVVQGLPAPMSAALAADLAEGYHWTPGGFEARPFEYVGHIAPAGSASSTAGDMTRYMLALLNGGTLEGAAIFSPRTARAFRTPLRHTPEGINGWARGFVVYALPGGRRGYGHPGATLSFNSNMVLAPDLGLGVFVATNTDTGADLAARLPGLVVRQFYTPPQVFPRPGALALWNQRSAFEGHYITTRRAYGGMEAFIGLLIGGLEVKVTPQGRLVTTTPGETRLWVPEGEPADGRFIALDGDERLVVRMAGGRAAAIQPAANAALYERAGPWREPLTLAILTGLAALAALATLAGVVLRNRREFRETSIQSRMALIQNTQAALWLVAMGLFAVWIMGAGDRAQVMYGWPGVPLVIASACALVAAALTLLTLVALPAIWRGGRRVDSWSPLRKLAFSLTVLVYAAYSVTLWMWGALSPWSG